MISLRTYLLRELQREYPTATEEQIDGALDITYRAMVKTVRSGEPDLAAAIESGRSIRELMNG